MKTEITLNAKGVRLLAALATYMQMNGSTSIAARRAARVMTILAESEHQLGSLRGKCSVEAMRLINRELDNAWDSLNISSPKT